MAPPTNLPWRRCSYWVAVPPIGPLPCEVLTRWSSIVGEADRNPEAVEGADASSARTVHAPRGGETRGWWKRARTERAMGRAAMDSATQDRDDDTVIAIRAGIWASATDLPCTIWKELNPKVIDHLLEIYPVDDYDLV